MKKIFLSKLQIGVGKIDDFIVKQEYHYCHDYCYHYTLNMNTSNCYYHNIGKLLLIIAGSKNSSVSIIVQ